MPFQHHILVQPDALIDHDPTDNAAVAISLIPNHGDLPPVIKRNSTKSPSLTRKPGLIEQYPRKSYSATAARLPWTIGSRTKEQNFTSIFTVNDTEDTRG